MYFEVFKKGKLIRRGAETLGELSFDHELMYAPTCSLTLPIEWAESFDGREEVKIFINGKCFWGIVWDIEVDKAQETVDLSLRHVISEWEYRQISVNHAISNKALNIVYKGDKNSKNTGNDEAITASDFSVSLAEGKKLTNAQIIAKSFASAWKISNGDKVAITKVQIQKCETKDGKEECKTSAITEATTYRVVLSTAKGTSVAVDLNVQEKAEPEYGTLSDPSVIDNLKDIYNDMNFAYPGWIIDMQGDAPSRMIDYVYSKQNKLEALTQTMELTDDLFWRVGWGNERKVEIGTFGEKKPYIISTKPSGKTNIMIIQEPVIDYDFDNVFNVATVYSDKSDSGMASLTLREIYNNPSLQDPKFPVIILRAGVNNERDYSMYNAPNQPMSIAPNSELEYSVIDTESIALEQGTLIEGSLAFNDINPFEIDSKKVTDAKRLQAAKSVYKAAIRKLRQVRRSYDISVVVEEIPADLLPGDRVRFIYDNSIWNLEACSSYWKKILSYDDWFYITSIDYEIDSTGVETNTLKLAKWIKVDRETQVK